MKIKLFLQLPFSQGLILTLVLFTAFFLNTTSVSAATNTLNFQSKIVNLTDGTNIDTGTPACVVAGNTNDTCDFRVNIYDDPSAGNLLFSEDHVNTEIGQYNGIFNLEINSVCNVVSDTGTDGNWTDVADPCVSNGGVDFSTADLWIEIEFDPTGTSTYTETFSRVEIRDVASARYAVNATYIDGFTSGDFVQFRPAAAQTTTSTNTLINLETTANTANPLININENGAGTPDLLRLQNTSTTVFSVNNAGDITTSGDIAINGGDLTTTAGTFNLVNAGATTINGFGAATTVNLGIAGASGTMNLMGGSASTGCTINGTTGDFSCTGTFNGVDLGDVILQGGNIFGTTVTIGSNDNFDLDFITNGLVAMTIDNSQNVSINNDLTVTGDSIFNSNVTLGDAAGDTITFNGTVDSDIDPFADNTYDLGSLSNRFRDLYLGPGSLKITSTTGTGGTGANYTLLESGFNGGAARFVTTNNGTNTAGNFGAINFQSGMNTGQTTNAAFDFRTTANLGAADELFQVSDNNGGTPIFTLRGDSTAIFTGDTSLANSTCIAYTFALLDCTGNGSFGGVVGIGTVGADSTTFLNLTAADVATSSLRINDSVGADVAAPVTGDLWWNGTELFFFDGTTNIDLLAGGSCPTCFVDGGNSFGGAAVLGTNDNFSLSLETNATTKVTILDNGNVGIGVNMTAPLNLLSVGNSAFEVFHVNSVGEVIQTVQNTTGDAYTLTNNGSLSSGNLLNLIHGGASLTGNLQRIAITGNNAANTGDLLELSVTGASNAARGLFVSIAGTGQLFRFQGNNANNNIRMANDGSIIHQYANTGGTMFDFSTNVISTGTVLHMAPSSHTTGIGLHIERSNGNVWTGDLVRVTSDGLGSGAGNQMGDLIDLQVTNTSGFFGGAALRINSLAASNAILVEQGVSNFMDKVGVGKDAIGTSGPALLSINENTTALAQINLETSVGVNVTTPTNGDLWWNGTNLNFRAGAVTVDLLAGACPTCFVDGGNSFGAGATLGTNDAFGLAFETSGTSRLTLDTSGHLTPNVDDTYDLGSTTNRFRDLYLGPATLNIGNSSDDYDISFDTAGAGVLVFNEAGEDDDLRIEGDTNANLFYVDASTDRIGIGTATPASYLDILTSSATPGAAMINVNENGAGTADLLRLQNTGSTVFTVANDGRVGVFVAPTTNTALRIESALQSTYNTGDYDPLTVITTNDTTGGRTYGIRSVINTGAANVPGSLRAIRGEIVYSTSGSTAAFITSVSGFTNVTAGTLTDIATGISSTSRNTAGTVTTLQAINAFSENLVGGTVASLQNSYQSLTNDGTTTGRMTNITTTTTNNSTVGEHLLSIEATLANASTGTVTGNIYGVTSTVFNAGQVSGDAFGILNTYTNDVTGDVTGDVNLNFSQLVNDGLIGGVSVGYRYEVFGAGTFTGDVYGYLGVDSYSTVILNDFKNSLSLSTSGDIQLNGDQILTTNAGTIDLFPTTVTTLNVGRTGANGTLNFMGGDSDTGCTLNGATGDLTCTGTIAGGVAGAFFEDGGNSFGATAVLGTLDTEQLEIITDGTLALSIATNQDITTSQQLEVGTSLFVNQFSGFGTGPISTAYGTFAAATSGVASINIQDSASTNVVAPVSGDLWWNGTELYFFDGSVANDILGGGCPTCFVSGGNSFGSTAQIGTTDTNNLEIIVDSNVAMIIDPSQFVTFNGSALLFGNLESQGGVVRLANLPGATGGTITLCIDPGTEELYQGASSNDCDPSSLRYKHDIQDLEESLGLDALKELRAVSFTYNSSGTDSLGFIAEEVGLIDERLIVRNSEGLIDAINSNRLLPIIVKGVQELSNSVDSQFIALDNLEDEVDTLGLTVNSQTATLGDLGNAVNSHAAELLTLASADQNQLSLYNVLETRVTALENSVLGIDSRVAALEGAGGSIDPNNFEVNIAKINERLVVGDNTAGTAIVSENTDTVEFTFPTSYLNTPIVTVSPLDFNQPYRLLDVTPYGFKIQLDNVTLSPVTFNWIALGK